MFIILYARRSLFVTIVHRSTRSHHIHYSLQYFSRRLSVRYVIAAAFSTPAIFSAPIPRKLQLGLIQFVYRFNENIVCIGFYERRKVGDKNDYSGILDLSLLGTTATMKVVNYSEAENFF